MEEGGVLFSTGGVGSAKYNTALHRTYLTIRYQGVQEDVQYIFTSLSIIT